jgi:arsenate reductase
VRPLAPERHRDEAARADAAAAEWLSAAREREKGAPGEDALLARLDVHEDLAAGLALRERESPARLLEAEALLVALGGEERGEAFEVGREVQARRCILGRRMPREYVLWFDARCATCKRALELLRARGVEPTLRRFLEEPPAPDELADLLARLGAPPRTVARKDADEYQALRLSDRTPDAELVRAIAQHPRILEGPILVAGDRAVLAKPPERVLELLAPA